MTYNNGYNSWLRHEIIAETDMRTFPKPRFSSF